MLHISIRGDSELFGEVLAAEGTVSHVYAAPEDCALDDEAAWLAANPGLGTIKSKAYMVAQARRAASTPADQASFRAHDLNAELHPTRTMICSPADWARCEVEELPPRRGRAYVGFDLGGSSSMTAAAALWPLTGRLELWAAFPDDPDLRARGEADGVGALYLDMARRGELRTYPGRVTPVGAFLGDVAAELAGADVTVAGADRYRRAEAEQALAEAGCRWPMVWRGQGASATADGSHDVRSCQRRIMQGGALAMEENLLMRSAVRSSELRFDAAGNPALCKSSSRSRIDGLSAVVIACGLAALDTRPPPRPLRSAVIR